MPSSLPPAELNDETLVLQLRAQWDIADFGAGECSWSFVSVRTGFVDQAAELWDRWRDNIKPLFMARRPSLFVLRQVVIEDRWPEAFAPIQIDLNESPPEPDLESASPTVTPVITWNSGIAGRSYRGRSYWGCIRRDDQVSAGVSGDLTLALFDFINGMDATFMTTAGLRVSPSFAIVSRQHNNVPEPRGKYVFVNSGIARPYLGTQRRRQTYYL
jgi:hypothetical protein